MKNIQIRRSSQSKSVRNLEKVKGIAGAGTISSRSFKENEPKQFALGGSLLKTFESKLGDLTREASMMYSDISAPTKVYREPVNLPELSSNGENYKFKELLDENTKLVLNVVTLTAISKKKLVLPPRSCLPGRVDLCGKTLPAIIELESKNQNLEILVAFNKFPTRQNYELKFVGNRALIPAKYISELSNNFSIRFIVMSSDLVFCNAFVRLANKPRQFFLVDQVKDGNHREASRIDEIMEIELNQPFRKVNSINDRKNASVIEQNMNSIYSHSRNQLAEKFKNTAVVLDTKIKSARLKKEFALEVRKSQLLQSLKKHESAQQKAQNQLIDTVNFLIQKAVDRVWIQSFITYRMFYGMIGLIKKKKSLRLVSHDMTRKTLLIQKKLKPILGWLIKDKNKSGFEKAKSIIYFHSRIMRSPIYERAQKVAGIGMKEFYRVISLRNHIFNKVSYYIKIQNKWKDFLRNKQRARMIYNKNLEQVYTKLTKIPEIFEKDMLKVSHHFTQRCKEDIFDLFFNKRLMEYIHKKVDYMAERAMLVDVSLYFQELQDCPDQFDKEDSKLEERKNKLLKFHLEGVAICVFRAWLVCKSPTRVQIRTEGLKKRLIEASKSLNVVPLSLVKVRHFPTLTTWLYRHSRFDLLTLIKENYRTHKYEAAAYRLGDLDVASSLSPRRRKTSKAFEVTGEERERLKIIQDAKEKSVGIRRIMALLARDYTEKFEIEFTNELLVTIILSALEYYAHRYSSSLKVKHIESD
jgi:hypothetical protein